MVLRQEASLQVFAPGLFLALPMQAPAELKQYMKVFASACICGKV